MNKLTNQQLKELVQAHEVKWNLTILNQKSQELVDLTTKLLKTLETAETEPEIDQTQLLKDLEKLRITKHHLKGIRLVNFYQALKGETPRYPTTEKFDAKVWEERREKRRIERENNQKK